MTKFGGAPQVYKLIQYPKIFSLPQELKQYLSILIQAIFNCQYF